MKTVSCVYEQDDLPGGWPNARSGAAEKKFYIVQLKKKFYIVQLEIFKFLVVANVSLIRDMNPQYRYCFCK
jgi:hypothetical protein